jgi:hypothetical protein
MIEEKKILTVHIGTTDIFEWTMNQGKSVIMPELLVGCEELLYNDLDIVKCIRIEAIIRGKSRAYDFNVERSHVSDTLDKILKWALIEEEYEICERVKNLNEYLENNTF